MCDLFSLCNGLKQFSGAGPLLHAERQAAMDQALAQEYVDGRGQVESEALKSAMERALTSGSSRICADTVAMVSSPLLFHYITMSLQRKLSGHMLSRHAKRHSCFCVRFLRWCHQRGTLYICPHALQKPNQSVCAYGLTSWGFMVNKKSPEAAFCRVGGFLCFLTARSSKAR